MGELGIYKTSTQSMRILTARGDNANYITLFCNVIPMCFWHILRKIGQRDEILNFLLLKNFCVHDGHNFYKHNFNAPFEKAAMSVCCAPCIFNVCAVCTLAALLAVCTE